MTRRVLIVEDDPDIARLVGLQLAELDCESRIVGDGVTALAEAEAGRWDLVILDVMLPRLDGLQVCRRLRAAESHTPILMLTAKSSELDRVLGLELGADDYLTKPFSMLELAARVKGVFRRAEQLAAAKTAAQAPPSTRARNCSTRSGATATAATSTPSTRTSIACATRSSATPPTRTSSRPSGASATSSRSAVPELDAGTIGWLVAGAIAIALATAAAVQAVFAERRA